MKIYAIPKTQDPYVNTSLFELGPDPATGERRYWLATYNNHSGATGVLLTETGTYRTYTFRSHTPYESIPVIFPGFYNAAVEDSDTLWLLGTLNFVVRLCLSTGEYEAFPTGQPGALSFGGMVFDPATKKLLLSAHNTRTHRLRAVSFDTVARRVVREYDADHPEFGYDRWGYPCGGGKYALFVDSLKCGEKRLLLCWNPTAETLEEKAVYPGTAPKTGLFDGAGRLLLNGLGWLNPATFEIEPGPEPPVAADWFGISDAGFAYGCARGGDLGVITRWDMAAGTTGQLAEAPSLAGCMCKLTSHGDVICVNSDCVLSVFSGADGSLLLSKRLDTRSIGHADCLIKADDNWLLGTPFITQRFWMLDLQTGEGFDAGRAAPGGGEILRVARLNGKVYMASYTTGSLMELDPAAPIHYPDNPRQVARPVSGMRPSAMAQDGRHIYYASNYRYGYAGCVVTKYDTQTGLAQYREKPWRAQRIESMHYDPAQNLLVCGTCYLADCDSFEASDKTAWLLLLDAATLEPAGAVQAPAGTVRVEVLGPLDSHTYAIRYGRPGQSEYARIDIRALSAEPLPAGLFEGLAGYGDLPGEFVFTTGGRLTRCAVSPAGRKELLCYAEGLQADRIVISGGNIFALRGDDITVFDL